MATAGAALAILALVACGSSDKNDNTSAAGQSNTTAATTPATTAAPAPTTTAAAAVLKAGANGILTDTSGKTLYTRDTDPAGGSS